MAPRKGDFPMHSHLTPEELAKAFWAKVDPCRTDGCVIWLGYCMPSGYGQYNIGKKHFYSHHFLVGRPPVGLEWDHVKARGCFNKNCIWPEHLELVTHRENILRGTAPAALHAKKTHCPKGHPYDEVNTYMHHGGRECRICILARSRARYNPTAMAAAAKFA